MRNRKFTDEIRAAMIRDYLRGDRPVEIAKRYGVCANYPRQLAQRTGHNVPKLTSDREKWGWARAIERGPVIA